MQIRFFPALLVSSALLFPAALWAQETPSPQDSDLQLMLAKVNLDLQTNKLDEAASIISQMKTRYPDNPQVLQAQADLDLLTGNRGAAFAALNRAGKLDPNNEDIATRERIAMLDQGPFVGAGYQYRHTEQADEQLAHINGQAALSSSASVQLNVDNDYISTNQPIITVHGVPENSNNDRQRGSATFGKVFGGGDEANASLYANDRTPGAGAQYSLWDSSGATILEGNVRKPDWDYAETVIEDGTRDNIHLQRKQLISNHFLITLGGGYNNYNLHDDNNVAGAVTWDLNAAYSHPVALSDTAGDNIILGANYMVIAEYFTHMQRRTDISGNLFKPFPTNSYEIHSLTVSAGKEISSQFYAEGYGGYSMDRLGSNGPMFGAVVDYSPTKHIGIELSGSRTLLGGINNAEKEDLLGLNLKWRW